MKRLVFPLISMIALGCAGGAPRRSDVATASPRPPPPSAAPKAFADSPVSGLAEELCALGFDALLGRPLKWARIHFSDVERHVSNETPTPRPPCLAATFDVRTELRAAPSNDERMFQTNFYLSKRRLVAQTHSYGADDQIHVTENVAAFPEIVRLFDGFLDALAADGAKAFQSSELECQDLGVSEGGKCEAEMRKPLVRDVDAAALKSSGKNRAISLSGFYAFARAADGRLVRMQLMLEDAPTLVLFAETRDP